MYPDQRHPGRSARPSASGDTITASVVRSGTNYTLKVTDSTHYRRQLQQDRDLLGRHLRGLQRRVDRGGPDRLGRHLTRCRSSRNVDRPSDAAVIERTAKSGNIKSFTDDEITIGE